MGWALDRACAPRMPLARSSSKPLTRRKRYRTCRGLSNARASGCAEAKPSTWRRSVIGLSTAGRNMTGQSSSREEILTRTASAHSARTVASAEQSRAGPCCSRAGPNCRRSPVSTPRFTGPRRRSPITMRMPEILYAEGFAAMGFMVSHTNMSRRSLRNRAGDREQAFDRRASGQRRHQCARYRMDVASKARSGLRRSTASRWARARADRSGCHPLSHLRAKDATRGWCRIFSTTNCGLKGFLASAMISANWKRASIQRRLSPRLFCPSSRPCLRVCWRQRSAASTPSCLRRVLAKTHRLCARYCREDRLVGRSDRSREERRARTAYLLIREQGQGLRHSH